MYKLTENFTTHFSCSHFESAKNAKTDKGTLSIYDLEIVIEKQVSDSSCEETSCVVYKRLYPGIVLIQFDFSSFKADEYQPISGLFFESFKREFAFLEESLIDFCCQLVHTRKTPKAGFFKFLSWFRKS